MADQIAVDIEAVATKVADAILAKVPFGSLLEGVVNDAVDKIVEAVVAKVEAEVKAVFHI